ncbi:MAG TPA: hypothetical protein VGG33_26570 [Polyangia bacterium]
MKNVALPRLLFPALIAWLAGCSSDGGGTDAEAGMPDGSASDIRGSSDVGDLPIEMADAAADAPTDVVTGAIDAGDARPDAPQPWPPPGVLYLTNIPTLAAYTQLHQNRREVPFFFRRRGNDGVYPYPWDRDECIFHVPISHLSFLRQIDPERAVRLYFEDAKSEAGSLIPGRFIVDETDETAIKVLFENTVGLMATPVFPLDATAAAELRARFMRCVPFARRYEFLKMCEDGEACALP